MAVNAVDLLTLMLEFQQPFALVQHLFQGFAQAVPLGRGGKVKGCAFRFGRLQNAQGQCLGQVAKQLVEIRHGVAFDNAVKTGNQGFQPAVQGRAPGVLCGMGHVARAFW